MAKYITQSNALDQKVAEGMALSIRDPSSVDIEAI
jgi:hypothetical protein